MGIFKKKPADPISARARELQDEIAALESQIQRLSARQQETPAASTPENNPPPKAQPESIFESVSHQRVKSDAPQTEPSALYNEDLGVRKYDPAAAWRRLLSHFSGPPANNPKLVNYLAAGSIQGLRPLRYEKRVARNRFLFLFFGLLFLLIGIVSFFFRHR